VDSAGTTTYRRDGAGVLSPVLEAAGTKFTPGISRRTGTTSAFNHVDRLGSNTRQTSTAQGSIASRQYDAFGNLAATSGTWTGPFGFVGGGGYQEDSDSGLQLLGHRYYDSSIGRFLTRDPVKHGRNWFSYCGNNPLAMTDTTGLMGWPFPFTGQVISRTYDELVVIGEPTFGGYGWQVLPPFKETNPFTYDVDWVYNPRTKGLRKLHGGGITLIATPDAFIFDKGLEMPGEPTDENYDQAYKQIDKYERTKTLEGLLVCI